MTLLARFGAFDHWCGVAHARLARHAHQIVGVLFVLEQSVSEHHVRDLLLAASDAGAMVLVCLIDESALGWKDEVDLVFVAVCKATEQPRVPKHKREAHRFCCHLPEEAPIFGEPERFQQEVSLALVLGVHVALADALVELSGIEQLV